MATVASTLSSSPPFTFDNLSRSAPSGPKSAQELNTNYKNFSPETDDVSIEHICFAVFFPDLILEQGFTSTAESGFERKQQTFPRSFRITLGVLYNFPFFPG